MLVSISQLNQAQLTAFIASASSGSAFSGNILSYANGSGTFGPNVMYTYGDQSITGRKRFYLSPDVPYYDGSGRAPSALYVLNQDLAVSGVLNGYIDSVSGFMNGISGLIPYIQVTGSDPISIANLTGIGTTVVTYANGYIRISGAAAGGGGGGSIPPGIVYITGDQTIAGQKTFSDPAVFNSDVGLFGTTFVIGAIEVPTPSSGPEAINLDYLLDVSGVLAAGGGGGSPNSVTTTGNEVIGGFKRFTGSPFVPIPTQPSGAANLLWVGGVSGVLVTRDLAISGAIYAQMTGISGAFSAGGTINNYYITGTGIVTASSTGIVTNTFNITSGTILPSSSGTVNNVFNGTVNNNINIGGITGNFVNMSFWFDQYNLATGLNFVEGFVSRDFFFTGYALAAINTGTQGYFSGSFYQRTPTNVKTNFINFSLNSGTFFSANGGYIQTITGMNRVGLDIYLIGTGITGLSVGLFGVGY